MSTLINKANQAYYIDSRYSLIWQTWGDDYIVFHSGTGNTHQLPEASANLLMILEKKACSSHDLAQAFSQAEKLSLDDDVFKFVAQVLLQFKDLGIIQTQ